MRSRRTPRIASISASPTESVRPPPRAAARIVRRLDSAISSRPSRSRTRPAREPARRSASTFASRASRASSRMVRRFPRSVPTSRPSSMSFSMAVRPTSLYVGPRDEAAAARRPEEAARLRRGGRGMDSGSPASTGLASSRRYLPSATSSLRLANRARTARAAANGSGSPISLPMSAGVTASDSPGWILSAILVRKALARLRLSSFIPAYGRQTGGSGASPGISAEKSDKK